MWRVCPPSWPTSCSSSRTGCWPGPEPRHPRHRRRGVLGDFQGMEEGQEVHRTVRCSRCPWARAASAAWWSRWASPSTTSAPLPRTAAASWSCGRA
ncbi:hypothetical protein QJS66_00275 [Kocuria rhizophila]|nr:hypothetical protein QJS66_00275 [Kocuria rhizophila]